MLTPVILANVFRLHSFFVWFCVAARNSCQFLRIAGVETKNSFMSRTIITVLFFFFLFSKGGGRVAGSGMARNLGQREATVIRPCDRVLQAGADLQRTTR